MGAPTERSNSSVSAELGWVHPPRSGPSSPGDARPSSLLPSPPRVPGGAPAAGGGGGEDAGAGVGGALFRGEGLFTHGAFPEAFTPPGVHTPNPEPLTLNPKPQRPKPKPSILNPKP